MAGTRCLPLAPSRRLGGEADPSVRMTEVVGVQGPERASSPTKGQGGQPTMAHLGGKSEAESVHFPGVPTGLGLVFVVLAGKPGMGLASLQSSCREDRPSVGHADAEWLQIRHARPMDGGSAREGEPGTQTSLDGVGLAPQLPHCVAHVAASQQRLPCCSRGSGGLGCPGRVRGPEGFEAAHQPRQRVVNEPSSVRAVSAVRCPQQYYAAHGTTDARRM